MMAGGAVALEAWLPRLAKPAFAGALLAGAAVTAPLFLPVLPIEAFIAYQRALGIKPGTGERLRLGELPQYYADMFGWPEIAEAVGKAYQALPPEDRARAVFFGWNYGDAAAVDVLGGKWGLPPAISGHENYFLWGPRGGRRQRRAHPRRARERSSKCSGPSRRSAGSTIPWGCRRNLARRYGFAATRSSRCSRPGRGCGISGDGFRVRSGRRFKTHHTSDSEQVLSLTFVISRV